MSAEACVQWMIAELSAYPSLVTMFEEENIGPADIDALPSREGVFVQVEDEVPIERHADSLIVQVHIARRGRRTDCAFAAREVRKCLHAIAGSPKTWLVNPSTKALRLKSIKLIGSIPAGKPDPGNQDFYVQLLKYRVIGKSMALPS